MENIRGHKDIIDCFYRYKMPIMKIKQNKNQTTMQSYDIHRSGTNKICGKDRV